MCSCVDQGKHHAQNHEPNNHTQPSEVHVELHHLPDSDARPGRESEPGVSGDHVTAAGGDRLVGPHGSRNKRHRGLPQRFTPRERVSLQLQIADCSADQEILIEPRIDALKLRSCLTLFRAAAPKDRLFQRALDVFFAGEADAATIERLD